MNRAVITRATLAVTLLTASILAPQALVAQTAPAPVPVLRPGIHVRTLAIAGDIRVPYAISVPRDYSPTRHVPLILALHFGGNPNGAAVGLLRMLVVPALEELNAVIVAPESMGGGWGTAANERAVNALLEAIESSYRIDARRTAVTGFSMGGSGAWLWGARRPERFRAVVAVAGRPPESAAGWRVPVLAIHSHDDEVVPIGPTAARINELRAAGIAADLVELEGISHYETPRFADGLRQAVAWLRRTWEK